MTSSEGRILHSDEVLNLQVDDVILANTVEIVTTLLFANGAANGLVLTSDDSGFASWQPVSGPAVLANTQQFPLWMESKSLGERSPDIPVSTTVKFNKIGNLVTVAIDAFQFFPNVAAAPYGFYVLGNSSTVVPIDFQPDPALYSNGQPNWINWFSDSQSTDGNVVPAIYEMNFNPSYCQIVVLALPANSFFVGNSSSSAPSQSISYLAGSG